MKHGAFEELRFTRNRWGFILCASAFLSSFMSIAAGAAWLALPFPCFVEGEASGDGMLGWAALLLLFVAIAAFGTGRVFLRRSYIVATVLGLDILPLVRPAKRMILVGWNEVEGAVRQGNRLVLKRRGLPPLALPLGSMRGEQRILLQRVVEGRLQQRREGGAPGEPCP